MFKPSSMLFIYSSDGMQIFIFDIVSGIYRNLNDQTCFRRTRYKLCSSWMFRSILFQTHWKNVYFLMCFSSVFKKNRPVDAQFINFLQNSSPIISINSSLTSISDGISILLITTLFFSTVRWELKQNFPNQHYFGCILPICCLIVSAIIKHSSRLNCSLSPICPSMIYFRSSSSTSRNSFTKIPAIYSLLMGSSFPLMNSDIYIIVIQIINMKGHQRQISEQVRRVKQTFVDSSPYRLEVFAKNFKKKNQLPEPASSSTLNMGKHFELNRKTEIKGSPSRYENKNKTSRKRSLQKFMSNHRVTQRISFNHPPTTNQQATLSIKSKMMKINSILCTKLSGNNKSMINQVQNRYDEYRNIVKEWKGLGIFDEVDKLVMNLIENYVDTIEKMMENMCFQVSEKMKKYEQYVKNLEIENQKVKQEIQAYSNVEEMINPVRQRLLDEYEKCQWSTFVLNSLAQQSFDLEGFIKELPLYRKWIAPVIMQEQLKRQKRKQRMHLDLKIEKDDSTKPTLRSKSALINAIKSQRKDVGQV